MRRVVFSVLVTIFIVAGCGANTASPSNSESPLSLPTPMPSPSEAPSPSSTPASSASPQTQANFVYVTGVYWYSNMTALLYDVTTNSGKTVKLGDTLSPPVKVDAKNPAIVATVFVAKTQDAMTSQDYIDLQSKLKDLLATLTEQLHQITPPKTASLMVFKIMYADTAVEFFVADYTRVAKEYAKGAGADWDSVMHDSSAFYGILLPMVKTASATPKPSHKP